MPKKLTRGRATASVSRNRPLPMPTSTSTGLALPKSSDQLMGFAPPAPSRSRLANTTPGTSHTHGASSSRVNRRGLRTRQLLPLADRHPDHRRLEHLLVVHVPEGVELRHPAVDLEPVA